MKDRIDISYIESNERGILVRAEKHNYELFGRALEVMFAVNGGEPGIYLRSIRCMEEFTFLEVLLRWKLRLSRD